jgi:hypothetical protein
VTNPQDPHDVFEPVSDAESVRSTVENEGSNVCRAAALSSLLQEATPEMAQLAAEQRALGFSEQMIERGGRSWREGDALRSDANDPLSQDGDLDQIRFRRWNQLNETADPRQAVGFLVAMLGSPLERESAAAAAALWRGLDLPNRQRPPGIGGRRLYDRMMFDLDWTDRDPLWPWQIGWPEAPVSILLDGETLPWESDLWQRTYQRQVSRFGLDAYLDAAIVATLTRIRLDSAARSSDDITRSLAFAALEMPEADKVTPEPPPPPPVAAPRIPTLSTMIHGTWAWQGSWWVPGADFHRFIRGGYRPNVYSGGAMFSWSGAYKKNQRALAAQRFTAWAAELAPGGVQTLFGHSYGGEIAARAFSAGTPIGELILLSTPVTRYVEAASRSDVRVVDVRLRFDPVLAIARKGQRIAKRPNVTRVLLNGWRLSHGATHEESVWLAEDVAGRGQIRLESDLVER